MDLPCRSGFNNSMDGGDFLHGGHYVKISIVLFYSFMFVYYGRFTYILLDRFSNIFILLQLYDLPKSFCVLFISHPIPVLYYSKEHYCYYCALPLLCKCIFLSSLQYLNSVLFVTLYDRKAMW